MVLYIMQSENLSKRILSPTCHGSCALGNRWQLMEVACVCQYYTINFSSHNLQLPWIVIIAKRMCQNPADLEMISSLMNMQLQAL